MALPHLSWGLAAVLRLSHPALYGVFPRAEIWSLPLLRRNSDHLAMRFPQLHISTGLVFDLGRNIYHI